MTSPKTTCPTTQWQHPKLLVQLQSDISQNYLSNYTVITPKTTCPTTQWHHPKTTCSSIQWQLPKLLFKLYSDITQNYLSNYKWHLSKLLVQLHSENSQNYLSNYTVISPKTTCPTIQWHHPKLFVQLHSDFTQNYLSNYTVTSPKSFASSTVRMSSHSLVFYFFVWTHPTPLDESHDHCDQLCWWMHTDSDRHHEASHWEWWVNICLETAPLLELCEGWWAGCSYAMTPTKYWKLRGCWCSSLHHNCRQVRLRVFLPHIILYHADSWVCRSMGVGSLFATSSHSSQANKECTCITETALTFE